MKKAIMFLLAAVMFAAAFAACSGGEVPGPEKQSAADTDTSEKSTESAADPGVSEESSKSAANTGRIADIKQAKEFTDLTHGLDEEIEFRLPEGHQGNIFEDCGVNCLVVAECFDADVVAYHEYDKEGEVTQKTVGAYTFDFQSFDYMGLKDWHIYVIRMANTESRNQFEHRYYKIVYNVYGEGYPDSQIEKFMQTINLPLENGKK